MASYFPRFIDEEANENIRSEISKAKLKSVVESIQKDKTPSGCRWMVHQFLSKRSYDFMEEDLLKVVDGSKLSGEVLGIINFTFIALVPKKDNPKSEECRPISPCNILFKIIAKVTATRLKGIFSQTISQKQFDFLRN